MNAFRFPGNTREYGIQLRHGRWHRIDSICQHRAQLQISYRCEVTLNGGFPGSVTEEILHHEPRIAVEMAEVPTILRCQPIPLIHQRIQHDQHVEGKAVPCGMRCGIRRIHLVRIQPEPLPRSQDRIASAISRGENTVPRMHLKRQSLLIQPQPQRLKPMFAFNKQGNSLIDGQAVQFTSHDGAIRAPPYHQRAKTAGYLSDNTPLHQAFIAPRLLRAADRERAGGIAVSLHLSDSISGSVERSRFLRPGDLGGDPSSTVAARIPATGRDFNCQKGTTLGSSKTRCHHQPHISDVAVL
ncbi:hypothetical protein A5769_13565 [Mycobacterium intracellulare]|nr:hypothetical protein A5769_13565 [Mycobacterium intracellulare]